MRLFYLIVMTIFATLFLVTFFSYRSVKADLKECRALLNAHKALLEGDVESFKRVVRSEREVLYSISEAFDIILGRATLEVERGNYGNALEYVEMALKLPVDEKEKSEALLLKGMILYKMGDYKGALNVLKYFESENVPNRKRGLRLIEEIRKTKEVKE